MSDNYYNPFSLSGKTILVTGASSGIGRAIAVECSKMGARIILTARNEDRLIETRSIMDGEGHLIVPADLTSESDMEGLVNSISEVNGVVCAAGRLCWKPVKFYSNSAIEDTFRVNTFSAINLIKALLKRKQICRGSSLVFISSIASNLSLSVGNGIYCASKAAVEAFSRQCALELSRVNIRSNTIKPGLIDTPMTQDASENQFIMETPKIVGKPEDVAKLAVYLLSDAASFVTGADFVIDGGLSLQ